MPPENRTTNFLFPEVIERDQWHESNGLMLTFMLKANKNTKLIC